MGQGILYQLRSLPHPPTDPPPPQVYIDGVGAMSSFPKPVANLGIKVLKSKPLRSYAGKLSYHDPTLFSTLDAMNIGRVHTLREGWEEASVDYMLSGGFTTSTKVKELQPPTLILWGKQDQILDPALYANRFLDDLPKVTHPPTSLPPYTQPPTHPPTHLLKQGQAELKFIDNCGHVCHLEKPLVAAEEIVAFVTGREARIEAVGPSYGEAGASSSSSSSSSSARPQPSFFDRLFGGLGKEKEEEKEWSRDCGVCQNERVVGCINCEGVGSYETYGRTVTCSVCKGTGLMICKSCYAGDPEDIEGIRRTVREAAVRLGRAPK